MPAPDFLALVPLGLSLSTLPFMFGGRYPGWLALAEVSTFAAVAFLAFSGALRLRGGVGARVMTGCLATVATAAALSAVFSPTPATSYPLLLEWLWLGATGFLALVLARRQRGRELLVGMLLLAVIGEVFWSFYLWWGSRTPTHQQAGTFYAPNQYAGYVLLLAPLLLSLCLTSKSRLTVAGAGIAAAFLYLGVALSGSRAGVGAAGVGGLAAVLACRKHLGRSLLRTGLVVAGVAGLGLIMTSSLLFPSTTHAAASGAQGVLGVKGADPASLVMRLRWDRAALGMGVHHLLAGTGLGTFGAVLLRTANPSWQWSEFAHNQFLEAFAEGGLLMFAGMVALALAPLVAGGVALGRRRGEPDAWRLGLWAGLVGASVHLVLDHDWSYPAYAAAFVVVAALVVAPWDQPDPEPRDKLPVPSRTGLAGLALLALMFATGLYVSGRLTQGSNPSTSSLHLATALAPYAATPHEKLGARLASSGNPASLGEADGFLEGAAVRNRYDPALQWELAKVQTKLGKLGVARQAYEQAISIAPGSPNAYLLAAAFELDTDHAPERAVALLDRGITRLRLGGQGESPVPGLVALLSKRAQVAEQLAGPSAALAFAEQAVQVGPESPAAWSELRTVACDAGTLDIAEKASERLMALGQAALGPCPSQ